MGSRANQTQVKEYQRNGDRPEEITMHLTGVPKMKEWSERRRCNTQKNKKQKPGAKNFP